MAVGAKLEIGRKLRAVPQRFMAETPQFPETAADQPVPDPAVETSQPDRPEAVAQDAAAPQTAQDPLVELLNEAPSEPVPEAEVVLPPVAAETAAEPVAAETAAEPAAETLAEPVAEPLVEPVIEPVPEPEPAATPESGLWAGAPAPAAEPIEPASVLDGVASTITIPPRQTTVDGEGGEWDLLVSKVQAWIDGARFQERWDALGGPLRAVGLLLAALLVLRLYGALLDTLGDLPLLPRLLQLVGLVSLTRFALTRLVRSSERERILTSWRQRWDDFRGRA